MIEVAKKKKQNMKTSGEKIESKFLLMISKFAADSGNHCHICSLCCFLFCSSFYFCYSCLAFISSTYASTSAIDSPFPLPSVIFLSPPFSGYLFCISLQLALLFSSNASTSAYQFTLKSDSVFKYARRPMAVKFPRGG